jgi:hypothetical protein
MVFFMSTNFYFLIEVFHGGVRGGSKAWLPPVGANSQAEEASETSRANRSESRRRLRWPEDFIKKHPPRSHTNYVSLHRALP